MERDLIGRTSSDLNGRLSDEPWLLIYVKSLTKGWLENLNRVHKSRRENVSIGRKENLCECQWRKTLNDVLRLVVLVMMMLVVVHSIRIIKINWKCKTQICPAWSSFPPPVRKVTLRFQWYPSLASYVVPGGKPILCRYLTNANIVSQCSSIRAKIETVVMHLL